YYVSRPGLHGEARTANLGSVSRVPVPEIEKAIVSVVREHVGKQPALGDCQDAPPFDHATLTPLISRIEVQRNQLLIRLKPLSDPAEPAVVSIPWQKPPSKRSREILLPHGIRREEIRLDRAERRDGSPDHQQAIGRGNPPPATSNPAWPIAD